MLEVYDIRKSFGKTEVLKGINFKLEEGKVLVILGSSGSGKTTLLRSLNFLETPDSGKIIVDGETIFDASAPELSDTQKRLNRLKFGLVFQSFNLFPQYSVLKNVTLADEMLQKELLRAKKGRLSHADKAEIAAECDRKAKALLSSVGLSDKANSYPCELSGGQQQRAAIARALALSPSILCFDEPTSALDPELTQEVLKVIRSLKDQGRTMIVVTHEMEFAEHVGDRIIFMANGVIEEEGSPDDIFHAPKSRALQSFLAHTK
ncbi:MAG: amino acid ABC transporter ATP-binding protein [Ruminococcaceae bacterium]|nr:amino acid ABC transporter ATP-binding protein [Oscillospiraceae bacterium]